MNEKKTVYLQIDSDELARLYDCEAKLEALETAGVDNWTNYDEAMREYHEQLEKDKYIL